MNQHQTLKAWFIQLRGSQLASWLDKFPTKISSWLLDEFYIIYTLTCDLFPCIICVNWINYMLPNFSFAIWDRIFMRNRPFLICRVADRVMRSHQRFDAFGFFLPSFYNLKNLWEISHFWVPRVNLQPWWEMSLSSLIVRTWLLKFTSTDWIISLSSKGWFNFYVPKDCYGIKLTC